MRERVSESYTPNANDCAFMFLTPRGLKRIALGGINGFLVRTLRSTSADAVLLCRAAIATAQAHRDCWTLAQVLFVECLGIHDRTPLVKVAARISGLRLRNF